MYRRYYEAPIILAEYDCVSESLMDFKFPSPYIYVDEYVRNFDQIGEDKYAYMYKAMLKHRDLLAVAIATNTYLLELFPNRVIGEAFDGSDVRILESYHDYSSLSKEPIIPVGFERTVCPTIDVLITPGRIFYNQEMEMIFYKNKWSKFPHKPVKWTGKSLYKTLMRVGGEGIIYTGTDTPIIIEKK